MAGGERIGDGNFHFLGRDNSKFPSVFARLRNGSLVFIKGSNSSSSSGSSSSCQADLDRLNNRIDRLFSSCKSQQMEIIFSGSTSEWSVMDKRMLSLFDLFNLGKREMNLQKRQTSRNTTRTSSALSRAEISWKHAQPISRALLRPSSVVTIRSSHWSTLFATRITGTSRKSSWNEWKTMN